MLPSLHCARQSPAQLCVSKTSCPRAYLPLWKAGIRTSIFRVEGALIQPASTAVWHRAEEGCYCCFWISWGGVGEGGMSWQREGKSQAKGACLPGCPVPTQNLTEEQRPAGLPEPDRVLAMNLGTARMLQTPARLAYPLQPPRGLREGEEVRIYL